MVTDCTSEVKVTSERMINDWALLPGQAVEAQKGAAWHSLRTGRMMQWGTRQGLQFGGNATWPARDLMKTGRIEPANA